MKADNFRRKEGYSQGIRVELGGNARALSVSPMSTEEENGVLFISALILSNRRIPNGTYGGVRGRQMK